jgi:hypothetical protein
MRHFFISAIGTGPTGLNITNFGLSYHEFPTLKVLSVYAIDNGCADPTIMGVTELSKKDFDKLLSEK